MNFTINQSQALQEVINSTLINKLYDLFITHKSSHTISLSGNLYSVTGYKSLIEALNTLYPNLIITVPVEGQYILFEDANVESVIKTLLNKSAGEGITIADASSAVFTNETFRYNTNITKFNEFNYFTKANNNPPGELFNGCTNLIEINLNDVSIISNNEFQGTGITEINAPSLSSLGAQAFNSSKAKRIISLGNITSIPDRCFGYCTDLETVILPSSVISIEQGGFMNNESLTTINLNNITSIGNSGFNSCNLLNINVSNLSNIITLGGGVFERCYNIYGELNLPKLVSAGNNCFDSCGSITKVKCIGKLTSIPERFIPRVSNGTSSLTEVYLPYECTSLGVNAFHRCGNLTTIKLYTQSVDDWIEGETHAFGTLSKITTFSELCFVDCTSLQLTPNDIQGAVTIGNNAFKGVIISGTINCPNLTSLGELSFQNSTITSILDLGSILLIPYATFSGCTSLTQVLIPTTVTSIGGYAFNGCSSLLSVVGSSNVTDIGAAAFSGCSSLTSIDLSSVISIGGEAFWGCGLNISLSMPNLTTFSGDTLFRNTGITSISNLGSITSIPAFAFDTCGSLTLAIIPTTVTSIGNYAFFHCYNLTITMLSTTPPTLGQSCFDGIVAIKVPQGTLSNYLNAWSSYASIISES